MERAAAIPFRAILITGATSGIGRAIALELASPGVDVHLLGRDRERLADCAGEVEARGAAAIPHPVDLDQDAELERFEAGLGSAPVDVLIHSAGAVALGRVGEAPVADLDRQYRLNLRVPFRLTQLLLPRIAASRGQIVFINSGAGLNARPGWSQYAMTKHGLRALADSLREEVSDRGIRVLSVYPGRTATPMQQEVHRLEARNYDPTRFLDPRDVATQVATALRLPRSASVTDLSIRPTGA